MKIKVTQDDIDNGVRKNVRQCPVALAIRRHFKGKPVRLSPIWAWIDPNWFLIPDWVGALIRELDQGGTVAPFTFELHQITKPYRTKAQP